MTATTLRIVTWALCAVFLVANTSPGNAQGNDARQIGDWRLECKVLSGDKKVCALLQAVVNADTGKRILSLQLRRVGSNNTLALIAEAPLGIFLGAGIAGKVDDGKQFSFLWQRCTQRGCQAATAVDAELESALKAGKRLLIGFKAQPSADPITLGASLAGVTAGLKVLGNN